MKPKTKNRAQISVAIVTLNEEERIRACLESVSFADEIIVVDCGSIDKTCEIAESLGAKVIIEKWRGFSGQKQFAVDQCKNSWVLILDADERIPHRTTLTISDLVESDKGTIEAYGFRRKNIFHDKWIRHCGWWPDRIVRLVHKEKGSFNGRRVHEGWSAEGEVKELDDIIEHESFKDYSGLIAKMEAYSSLAAKEMFEHGASAGPFTPILHGFWMFFRSYIFKMGLLDGFDGFMISVMNAEGSFMKYAKLRELKAK